LVCQGLKINKKGGLLVWRTRILSVFVQVTRPTGTNPGQKVFVYGGGNQEWEVPELGQMRVQNAQVFASFAQVFLESPAQTRKFSRHLRKFGGKVVQKWA
jgi:hypothetical protein